MLRRILTVLAILACVGVVVVSQTKLRDHIQGIIDQRKAEETRANKAETSLRNTSTTLKNTSNTLVSVRVDLSSTSNELVTTKTSLETVTGARDKALADLEKAKEAEKTARQDLSKWDAVGMKPEQVKALQADFGKATNTVAALQEETRMLVRRVARLTNELNKYIDPDNAVVDMPKGLKGNIMIVDPKWEFVVLDIGEKQGVVKDGIMLVHRDHKLVGKVKITSVLVDRSIANVMPGSKLEEIREGDGVLF
jgi:hypothetical protein